VVWQRDLFVPQVRCHENALLTVSNSFGPNCGKRYPTVTENRSQILSRIEAIEAQMLSIRREAATRGCDLRKEWDRLLKERTALASKLLASDGR
jgi:hypothetical protein